ncbi:MAG: HEAT repeat domain-containing protein, partial [Gemmataceae bacterium]|nr:HEAT repeat domain-containing protein [Gemmataceae bacterium]
DQQDGWDKFNKFWKKTPRERWLGQIDEARKARKGGEKEAGGAKMNPLLPLVFLVCGLAQNAPARAPVPKQAGPTVAEVREVVAGYSGAVAINRLDDTKPAEALLALKEAAFPAYRVILADPKSTELEVSGVLLMIQCVQAPKAKFLPLVVPHLNHENWWVRVKAVRLVTEIGTGEECPILVALLSDCDPVVRNRAAEALVALGGAKELLAFDVWLRTAPGRREEERFVRHNKECRDKLDKRLKEAAEDKK